MNGPNVASASALGRELLAIWLRDGGEPRVPPNRRAEVIATLTLCMVDRAILEAYAGALAAGWRQNWGRPPISGYPARELPEDQIFRDGFAPLDETALGDIAVSPSAVRALHHVLRTVPATIEEFKDPGEWFFDALEEVMLPGQKPSRHPAPQVDPPPTRRWSQYVPWALAAAALIGAAIMWWSVRVPRPGAGASEVLMAQVTLTPPEPRGTNQLAFNLEANADREGFVTVILLPAGGGNPQIDPENVGGEQHVGPDHPATTGPFEAPAGSTVITVVTETRAADLIRQAVRQDLERLTPEAVIARVRDRLFTSGHKWIAIGTTVVVPAK